MDVIMNQVTGTVHKHEGGKPDCQTLCGIHYHLSHDNLHPTTTEQSNIVTSANKCGRCFDGGGGY